MSPRFRSTVLQVHLWVGLLLGILLGVLGLSGSVLVYEDALTNLLWPPPIISHPGKPLSLDAIAGIAQAVGGPRRIEIELPERADAPVIVRVGKLSPMMGPRPAVRAMKGMAMGGAEEGGQELFIDPVDGKVLAMRDALEPPVLVFAHQLHGNFLMGRPGRLFVGWLGVAMTGLGLTGLALWWPSAGRWRQALSVRPGLRGWRLYRDLHAALGFWSFVVFIIVSLSGVVIAFPQVFTPSAHPAGFDVSGSVVKPLPGDEAVGLDAAVGIATRTLPQRVARNVVLPARADRPIAVSFDDHGSTETVLVDPYRARVIAVDRPMGGNQQASFLIWQRLIHRGGGLGRAWKLLVFVSGLLPTFFVVTGATMWIRRRRPRLADRATRRRQVLIARSDPTTPDPNLQAASVHHRR